MTRFGVMKHLGVLEGADLVTTRKVGREKRHYLNPVPIRLVHDRWIGKFAEPIVGSMTAIKHHLEAPMSTVDHVYADRSSRPRPSGSGSAITDGDDTADYYFGTRVRSTFEVGAEISLRLPGRLAFAADGIVLEVEAGRKVVDASSRVGIRASRPSRRSP